jgi:lipopolysaccharide export system permease protein
MAALWRATSGESRAELQWRFAMPLASVVLALFAIPFGRIDPRYGRTVNVFFAIVIYVVYRNLLGMAKNWVDNGSIPAFPGVWLVHVVALLSAVPLLVRDARR